MDRAVLLGRRLRRDAMNTDDRALADLIVRLRTAAKQRSDIEREIAEAKSLRNSDGKHTDLYSWSTPEQTIEGQAADRLEAFHAKPVVGELGDYVAVRRDVISFLRGEGELDGQYYGDGTPPGEYRFWWRKYLAVLQSPPPVVSGEAKLIEAADYLISLYERLWKGGVVRDLAEAKVAYANAKTNIEGVDQ